MCSRRKFSQNKLAIFVGAIYNKLSVAGQGVLPLAGNLMKINEITGLETVISLTRHKSIYRRMYLRLEIDFIRVHWKEYYGTGIGGES